MLETGTVASNLALIIHISKAEQSRAEHIRAEQSISYHSKAEQSRAEQSRPKFRFIKILCGSLRFIMISRPLNTETVWCSYFLEWLTVSKAHQSNT